MYNNYMNTLFERDMSNGQFDNNMVTGDMFMQNMNMQQMPSSYFNQPMNGEMNSNFNREMTLDENHLMKSPTMPNKKVGDIFMYEVKRGDNLYGIARVFATTVENIACINKLEEPAMIHPGQMLLIPVIYETQKPIPPQPRQNYGMYF